MNKTVVMVGLASMLIAIAADAAESNLQSIAVIQSSTGPASRGPAQNFSGTVQVTGRFQSEAPARIGGATVVFEPGAHTAWHSHPLGQTLIVTKGQGFVQQWQQAAQAIGPGDVVWIPPHVKHWHGAAPHEALTHVALSEKLNDSSVSWMEAVSEAQYVQAVSAHPR